MNLKTKRKVGTSAEKDSAVPTKAELPQLHCIWFSICHIDPKIAAEIKVLILIFRCFIIATGRKLHTFYYIGMS